MIKHELETGKLVQCLKEYNLSQGKVFAIYPEREFMLPRLSLFLQMLKDYLSEQ